MADNDCSGSGQDGERATALKHAEMLVPVVSCRNRQNGAAEQMEKMGVARGASSFTPASAARATASCGEVVRGVERRTSANLAPLLAGMNPEEHSGGGK